MGEPSAGVVLSIGEVLKSLRDEFPDVTISKIRFLESEGLIEPERAPSGYRRFSPADVARLRYALRLQRDYFMPLKVIRQRLEHFDPEHEGESSEADLPTEDPDEDEQAAALDTALQLSFEELVASTGLSSDELRDLEEFGLIEGQVLDGGSVYDQDDLMVARIARDFRKYGIEPRHMKMYRLFAERESGLFEQVLLPMSRTAGSNGRRQMSQSMLELAKLSKRLKDLLLRAQLRGHFLS